MGEMNQEDSLGLYLHWLAERRKDDEARLKRLGLNWKTLDKIEFEALSQFPKDGVTVEGFRFVQCVRTRHVFPEAVAKDITKIQEPYITIHGER